MNQAIPEHAFAPVPEAAPSAMGPAHRHRAALWIVWPLVWLAHVALWMAFVDTLSRVEWIAACVAATFSVAAAALFQVVGVIHFRLAARYVAQIFRVPPMIAQGTWQVLKAMVLQMFTTYKPAGRLQAVRFDFGHADPSGTIRRTLAVVYPTLSPNTIVLGLVEEQNLLLYYQIIAEPVPTLMKRLGVRA